MNILKPAFSTWIPWNNREDFNNLDGVGVYLLASFDRPPAGKASPNVREIIYVGETCLQNFRCRWRQFDNSAFRGKHGHSGGRTYADVIGGKGANLFVAACCCSDLQANIRSFFVRYLERKLIWNYIARHGQPPKCNRK